MATGGRIVENVIMNERGGVDHFNGGGQYAMGLNHFAARLSRQQHQHRTHPFAPIPRQVVENLADVRRPAADFLREDRFDAPQ